VGYRNITNAQLTNLKAINDFHNHVKCTEFLHELLVIIQHDMLLPESHDRKSCVVLSKDLDRMYEKCRHDVGYATNSAPWHSPKRTTLSSQFPLARSHSTTTDEHDSQAIEPVLPSPILKVEMPRNRFEHADGIDAPTANQPSVTKPNPAANTTVFTPNNDDSDMDAWLEEDVRERVLENRIVNSFVASNFDIPDRYYLTETSIFELITKKAVMEELSHNKLFQQRPDDAKAAVIDWICNEAPKVFAITLQCNIDDEAMFPCMVMFKKHGFRDTNLPLASQESHPKAFPPKIWRNRIREFLNKQWSCLVPKFTSKTYDYDLPENCILPFTSQSAGAKDGSFSFVRRIRVHEHHMEHEGIKDVCICLSIG
jgi:hypothetical protein